MRKNISTVARMRSRRPCNAVWLIRWLCGRCRICAATSDICCKCKEEKGPIVKNLPLHADLWVRKVSAVNTAECHTYPSWAKLVVSKGKITMAHKGSERKPYRCNISRTVLKRFPTQVIVWENDTHIMCMHMLTVWNVVELCSQEQARNLLRVISQLWLDHV